MKTNKSDVKIKRFIECLVPLTMCNLKCNYCYDSQEKKKSQQLADFLYSPYIIGRALSQERLGGICYISMCGASETLLAKEIPDIIWYLLKGGHFVNITTNGTISKRIDQIINLPEAESILGRLHFSFSFHYLELLRVNKIDEFFNNVNKIREAGCSFLIQINLVDEYLPHLDEIKYMVEKRAGALPQVAATRNELGKDISLLTKYTPGEYYGFGNDFRSPLFDFTIKNFMVKRKEFCYAGDWSFTLNLSNGEMRKCYASNSVQNIFLDLDKPITFEAIGNNCESPYCINSSHFMSLGVIPSISTPSYADLRNRKRSDWWGGTGTPLV